MSAVRIPVVGIVGGIGSGKTALAQALARYVHCCRLDADAAGHRALQQPEIKSQLLTSFGKEIFDDQGEVIRRVLASRVFGDSATQQQARRRLEKIVHPYIRREIQQQLDRCQRNGEFDVVILDAALMLEAGWDEECDIIVFLDVPRESRIARTQSRGWSIDEFERREASQLPIEEKRERADVVIDNSQDLDSAAAALAGWLANRFELEPKATKADSSP